MSFEKRKYGWLLLVAFVSVATCMSAMAQDPVDEPEPTEVQADNMGVASYNVPAQSTETVTETRESSSSFSMGLVDQDDGPSTDDDGRAAPPASSNEPRRWGRPPPSRYPVGRGTYCEVPRNGQCRACAVDCPADRVAHCTGGDRGIFNKPDSTICPTEARCECR